MLESEGSARSAVLQFYVLTAAFCVIALAFSKIEGYWAIVLLGLVGLLTYRLVMNLGALSGERGSATSRAKPTCTDAEEK
jgi:hypothetical protein